MSSKVSKAYSHLEDLITQGWEFPDAIYYVADRYDLSDSQQAQVVDLYDEVC